MSLCKHCHEEAFDEEEQVCTRCGIVGNDVELKLDVGSSITFAPYGGHSKKSRLDPLSHGLGTLDELDTLCCSDGDVRAEAAKLFVSIHNNLVEKGKALKNRKDISTLAACCLMNSQRKSGNAMTVRDVCDFFNCPERKVKKMSKLLKIYLVDHPFAIQPDENAADEKGEIKIKRANLSSIECMVTKLLCKVPEEKKRELIQKTISLTKLAASCWLLTGRAGEGLVVAAAFLCWKSLHPHQKTTIGDFCTTYGLNKLTARSRVPELKSLLLKLGEQIPAVTENYVTKKNILYHLNYILENSESLRNDIRSGVFNKEEMDKKEYSLFRKSIVKPKPEVPFTSMYSADMNASDVDISDTEINSYIRTEDQVNFIKELKCSKKE